MVVTEAPLLTAAISGSLAVPLGFLIGWRAGWNEHKVRAAEDERHGICGRCLQPLPKPDSSQDRNSIGT